MADGEPALGGNECRNRPLSRARRALGGEPAGLRLRSGRIRPLARRSRPRSRRRGRSGSLGVGRRTRPRPSAASLRPRSPAVSRPSAGSSASRSALSAFPTPPSHRAGRAGCRTRRRSRGRRPADTRRDTPSSRSETARSWSSSTRAACARPRPSGSTSRTSTSSARPCTSTARAGRSGSSRSGRRPRTISPATCETRVRSSPAAPSTRSSSPRVGAGSIRARSAASSGTRIVCDMRSRRISSKAAPTYGRFRSSSVTPPSRRRRSTATSTRSACAASTTARTLARSASVATTLRLPHIGAGARSSPTHARRVGVPPPEVVPPWPFPGDVGRNPGPATRSRCSSRSAPSPRGGGSSIASSPAATPPQRRPPQDRVPSVFVRGARACPRIRFARAVTSLPDTRLDSDVERYLLLVAARRSPRTVDAYRRDLASLARSAAARSATRRSTNSSAGSRPCGQTGSPRQPCPPCVRRPQLLPAPDSHRRSEENPAAAIQLPRRAQPSPARALAG